MHQIADVLSICLEPVRVSAAQLSLPERPALSVGVPGERGRGSLAQAEAAFCRIPAEEQLNLSGHTVTSAVENGIQMTTCGRLEGDEREER